MSTRREAGIWLRIDPQGENECIRDKQGKRLTFDKLYEQKRSERTQKYTLRIRATLKSVPELQRKHAE
jgi:hypothetical protein